MKVVLDTNVVLSGFFFGGVPGRVLDAWHAERSRIGGSELLDVSGWRGIEVLRPKMFVERYLT